MIVPDNDREPWQAHTLRAWQEAFGTTQLTHAKARLERAEDHMRRVEEAEARCCPEDVGFEEWIGVLKKRLDEALRASPPEAEGPVAWIVHASSPYVTMHPPIEGGLPRTPLYALPSRSEEKGK